MVLRLYNTLTRRKEDFQPLDPANVRMYVCGPTVYDFAHIGNARPVIVFDVLFRLLRHIYGPEHVTYVRNITDVDDKINARALRDYPNLPLNEAIRLVTEKTANQFHADVKALGCLPPSVEPRATDNIAQMTEMISMLIKRGHAYVAGGEVLFAVDSMADYGRLSQRKLEDQQAGARVAVEAHKKNPADFVLWKLSSPEEPGWDSPWGRGRPGWHIECSAMSKRYLGEVFDIHGGGLDLIFPHHENEIAQSRCAHGTPVMARTWMHNGFLQVEGQKMSKSLGNFVTINELLKKWPGDVLRLNMLRTHYRQPIDWTNEAMLQSMKELLSWSEFIADQFGGSTDLNTIEGAIDEKVIEALSDDLNTPAAIAALHAMFDRSRTGHQKAGDFVKTLRFMGLTHMNMPGYFHPGFVANLFDSGTQILRGSDEEKLILEYRATRANGLTALTELIQQTLKSRGIQVALNDAGALSVGNLTSGDAEAEGKKKIDALIAARLEARKAKNWAESDRIRDELAGMGIAIKDNKDGTTTWEVKR